MRHKTLKTYIRKSLRIAAAIMLSLSSASAVHAIQHPKHEMRGAWLATVYGLDWPSQRGVSTNAVNSQKAQLDSIISRLHDAGFNAIFFQARPMADALYKSSYEPTSYYVTGKRGAPTLYDPLEYCIKRCHELGMECHAWINPFRVSSGAVTPSTPLDKKLSGMWLTGTAKNGDKTVTATILNPALKSSRDHICNICREIATRYDIDGIVFDDYFYFPEHLPENMTAPDWSQYLESGDGMTMGDWRRCNINLTISSVYTSLQEIKEGKIRFGVSPAGIAGGNGAHASAGVASPLKYGVKTADSQYSKIYSDPVMWLREGCIDYISPQIYWRTNHPRHSYSSLARWWNDVATLFGRHCYPSPTLEPLRDSNTPDNWNESIAQLQCNRDNAPHDASGTVFYATRYLCGPVCEGLDRELKARVFPHPALLPAMTWKEQATPLAIANLKIEGNILRWDRADDSRYVIYAIPKSEDIDMIVDYEDGISPDYIIGITYINSYTLPRQYLSGYHIAVTPYDRYGNEWLPTFL